jgi:hypothetical protein
VVAVNSGLSTLLSFMSVFITGTTSVTDDGGSFFVTLRMRFVSQVPLSGTNVLREHINNSCEERGSVNTGLRWGSAVACLMRLSSILCVLHVQRM